MWLRCADASTLATTSYFARRSGRRWISGCGSLLVEAWKKPSSWSMPVTGVPFHTTVPSKSISSSMTSGGVGGGGGGLLTLGISSLTAWVMTGSVTMSVTSSTSITSMSGVVLMSQKVLPALVPTLIDMV